MLFALFSPLASFSHSGSILSVGLGLTAAITWGGSDFAGGIGARRSQRCWWSPPAIWSPWSRSWPFAVWLTCPSRTAPSSLRARIGGLEGSLALAAFYKALAMGAMGLTAALTGLLTALVPVLFGLWKDGLPAPVAILGLMCGIIAIWLIAHAPGHSTPPAALWLGAVSGAGFGLQLVLLKLASSGGVLWALASARIGGVLGLVTILLSRGRGLIQQSLI